MVTQISKQTFIDLLETEESFEFLGVFDNKLYARQRVYSSKIPSKLRPPFRLVYANI